MNKDLIGLAIKKQIDDNNDTIQSLLNPNVFILNNDINKLLRENEELQSQCPHQFEDGYCIYCYMEEK